MAPRWKPPRDLTVWINPLRGHSPAAQQRLQNLRRLLGDVGQVHLCPDMDTLQQLAADLSPDSTLGVTGGDEGLSVALTALHHLGKVPDTVLPMGGDGPDLVRKSLGGRGKPEEVTHRLATLARKGPGLRRKPIQRIPWRTLRVVDSAQPSAMLGFTFGAGVLFDVAQEQSRDHAHLRGRVTALGRSLARVRDPIGARVLVDGEPFADKIWLLAASTLSELPLGMRARRVPGELGEDMHLLWSDQVMAGAALALPMARARLLREHQEVRSAREILLDLPAEAGYVLDGALHPTQAGGSALRLGSGPVITLGLLS